MSLPKLLAGLLDPSTLSSAHHRPYVNGQGRVVCNGKCLLFHHLGDGGQPGLRVGLKKREMTEEEPWALQVSFISSVGFWLMRDAMQSGGQLDTHLELDARLLIHWLYDKKCNAEEFLSLAMLDSSLNMVCKALLQCLGHTKYCVAYYSQNDLF